MNATSGNCQVLIYKAPNGAVHVDVCLGRAVLGFSYFHFGNSCGGRFSMFHFGTHCGGWIPACRNVGWADAVRASDFAPLSSNVALYHVDDGKTRVQCRFEDETVWLTEALMSELTRVTVPSVNKHLKGMFPEGELDLRPTIRDGRRHQSNAFGCKSLQAAGASRNSVAARAY